jgi:hypothetical protein
MGISVPREKAKGIKIGTRIFFEDVKPQNEIQRVSIMGKQGATELIAPNANGPSKL